MVETKIIKKLPVSKDVLESSREGAFQQKVIAAIETVEEKFKLLPSDQEIRERTQASGGYIAINKRGVLYRGNIACLMPDVEKMDVDVFYDAPYYKINGISYDSYKFDLIQKYMRLGGIEAQLPTAKEAKSSFKKNADIETSNGNWHGLFCIEGSRVKKYGVVDN